MDNALRVAHRALVENFVRQPWFSQADSFFELAAEKIGSTSAMGSCNVIFNISRPGLRIESKVAKFPFFEPVALARSGLSCVSQGKPFLLLADVGDTSATFAIGRNWGEPMELIPVKGSINVTSEALNMRLRFPGGEALLTSQEPIWLIVNHTDSVYSLGIRSGAGNLAYLKFIKGDPLAKPINLNVFSAATLSMPDGKVLREGESASALPGGLYNLQKANLPKNPPAK